MINFGVSWAYPGRVQARVIVSESNGLHCARTHTQLSLGHPQVALSFERIREKRVRTLRTQPPTTHAEPAPQNLDSFRGRRPEFWPRAAQSRFKRNVLQGRQRREIS